ncbi:organic cation/carnitine transporter 7-like [Zerene cesonia]|uniref:organic cation/carnitine transporter 7-like n=1 Tax=Zerene cesonia TaxID=33412 RepID=UPI0018E52F4B|nr:organic cation/carnitine transporter 7-like [Zerene cesonia]
MSHSVKTTWDFEEAFDLTGNGRYNYLALFACSVICIAVSLDIFGFSVVVDAAACDLELTIQQVGLLVSAPLVGILFAYPWGYLADTQGRRLAILISTSVGFVFSALSSFAVNWQMMLAAKVVGSSFSLSSLTLIMTYLGESVASKHRNEYLFLMNSVNLGAEMFSFALALILLPLPISIYLPWLSITFVSWRLYTFVMSLPLGFGALLMLSLQESPKFLFSNGEDDRTLAVLRKIYLANCGKKSQYPVKALIKSNDIKENTSFCGSLVRQTLPMFTPPLLWRTLQLFYLIILVIAVNNISLMWFPMMLDLVFNSIESDTVSGTFCENLVRNVTMSRPLENICQEPVATKTLAAGLLTSMFFGLLNLSVTKLAVTVLKQPIASVVFFASIQTVGLGIGCLASYFNDMYPTFCRSLATSLGFMLARLLALVGVIVIGDVVVHHCNLIFYTASVGFLSGIAVAVFLPPDKQLDT